MTPSWQPTGTHVPPTPGGPNWQPGGVIATYETATFSASGVLYPRPGRSRWPVTGGRFRVHTVAAAVNTPPIGAPIVLDVHANGTTLYPIQSHRPRILPGATQADVGEHTAVTVTDGDYLTVDIDQTGSTAPGADLVVTVRLQRIP